MVQVSAGGLAKLHVVWEEEGPNIVHVSVKRDAWRNRTGSNSATRALLLLEVSGG